MKIQRILFPTDFSERSKAAETYACDLAEQFGADLHVLHVLHDLFLAAPQTAVIRDGDPGLVIADYADECHADLIVMPSHGFHGVKRLLLGSVAERVLRHAKCPILMLRRGE